MTETEMTPASPAGAPCPAFVLDLCQDADRVAAADLVEDLVLSSRAVLLRVTDAAGRWLRVQVEGEAFATWSAA